MLACYKTEIPGDLFTLLVRKHCDSTKEIYIKDVRTSFGKWVEVPSDTYDADVYVHSTILGSLITTLYKPTSPLMIYFKLDNGKVYRYRIVPAVLKNGIYLRYFVKNQQDFNELLSGNTENLHRIKAIKIEPEGINLNYAQRYRIVFFKGV